MGIIFNILVIQLLIFPSTIPGIDVPLETPASSGQTSAQAKDTHLQPKLPKVKIIVRRFSKHGSIPIHDQTEISSEGAKMKDANGFNEQAGEVSSENLRQSKESVSTGNVIDSVSSGMKTLFSNIIPNFVSTNWQYKSQEKEKMEEEFGVNEVKEEGNNISQRKIDNRDDKATKNMEKNEQNPNEIDIDVDGPKVDINDDDTENNIDEIEETSHEILNNQYLSSVQESVTQSPSAVTSLHDASLGTDSAAEPSSEFEARNQKKYSEQNLYDITNSSQLKPSQNDNDSHVTANYTNDIHDIMQADWFGFKQDATPTSSIEHLDKFLDAKSTNATPYDNDTIAAGRNLKGEEEDYNDDNADDTYLDDDDYLGSGDVHTMSSVSAVSSSILHSSVSPPSSSSSLPPPPITTASELSTSFSVAVTRLKDEISPDNIDILRSRIRVESDFQTLDVSKLASHYEVCETCMYTEHETRHQCPYYHEMSMELFKWVNEFNNLLRFGCSGPGVTTHGTRCCHKPDKLLHETVQEFSILIKSLRNVLEGQCNKCPVDCTWADWSEWSNCPYECSGRGYKNRSRSVVRERYGGRFCHGEESQQKLCPIRPPELGRWSPWSEWSACSNTCGGVRHRTRTCTEPQSYAACFVPCVGDRTQHERCGDPLRCCHPRTWVQWSSWTSCPDELSADYNRTRWRTCEADEEYFDEPMCPQPCRGTWLDTESCCIHPSWSVWTHWSTCNSNIDVDKETTQPCGMGCRNRTRVCLPGTCRHDTCQGNHVETIECNLGPCCEIPEWTTWGQWEACTVSTGVGTRSRRRFCQPRMDKWRSPTCKAEGCFGRDESVDIEPCEGVCPNCVPPTWSEWESWRDCDFSLNPARRKRVRRCINPVPWDSKCAHVECQGSLESTEECVCDWTTWSMWSECDHNRFPPVRTRNRRCQHQSSPSSCPLTWCDGQEFEVHEVCCYPPEWSRWGQWSPCNNFPDQTRTRTCPRSLPGCVEQPCTGSDVEQRQCVRPTILPEPLCETGHWSQWGSWSLCSRCIHGEGKRSRSRHKTHRFSSYAKRPLCPPLSETEAQVCYNCPECLDSCENKRDDSYPSCKSGCKSYYVCCQGVLTGVTCQGDQQYNSKCRECTKPPSSTCPDALRDIYVNESSIPSKDYRCSNPSG